MGIPAALEGLGGEAFIERLMRSRLRVEIEGGTYWNNNPSVGNKCIDVAHQLIYISNPTLRVIDTPYYCALVLTNPIQVDAGELGDLWFTCQEGGHLDDVVGLPLELSYTYQCTVDFIPGSPLYIIRCTLRWLE